MAKPRVLITSYFLQPGDDVDRLLQEAGFETVFNLWSKGRTEDELIDIIQDVDAAIVSIDPFTDRVINSANRLKVISRSGVGYDTVDVDAATARGIAVCNTAGVNRHAVAEYAIGLMIQCSRMLVENLSEVRRGSWTRHQGTGLAGKTLGIIGLGTIGKEVAQRMRAFEMRILASDARQDIQFAEAHGVSYVPVDELLRESDFVSIHANLDARSRHIINKERLGLMKPTAYLVNTARGGLIDTEALYWALKERRIAGAALDVFEQEPLDESPLRELDNIYLSPHCAGSTDDAHHQAGLMAAENAIRVLNGEPPLHIINPAALKHS